MLQNANNQRTTILHTLKVDYTLGDFEVILRSYTYWWLFRGVNGLSYSSLFIGEGIYPATLRCEARLWKGIAGFGGKCRLLDLGLTWMMARSLKFVADAYESQQSFED
ncbi:hypothetical protein HanPI659440_Chr10g0391001 [Helianthus annuus]|nr:hypothetical protein HanPI659440_Chr10g0391001 [Helianthus annuus]